MALEGQRGEALGQGHTRQGTPRHPHSPECFCVLRGDWAGALCLPCWEISEGWEGPELEDQRD